MEKDAEEKRDEEGDAKVKGITKGRSRGKKII